MRVIARVANYPLCQKHLTQKWFKQSLFNSNNYSPCSLCSVNHSSICWSSLGNFEVKRPMVVRFADIFNSPLNSLASSFRQRRTMDSLSPYSRAISELFSTASASATTLSLKAMLYDEQRAFGMMNVRRSIDYLTSKRLTVSDCL